MMKRSTERRAGERSQIELGGWQHVRLHAARRMEEALDEIPGVLRHVRIFLLVASITMMVFATGLLVVLWKAVS
jgi:hypothetical protein